MSVALEPIHHHSFASVVAVAHASGANECVGFFGFEHDDPEI
jgi:hypothetical protein